MFAVLRSIRSDEDTRFRNLEFLSAREQSLTTASHQNSATSPTLMDVSRVSQTSILNILPTKISAGLPASRLSSMTVRSKLSSSVWKWKTSWRRRQERVPIRLTRQSQHRHKAFAQMKEAGIVVFTNSAHVPSWKHFVFLWMSCFYVMEEIYLIMCQCWTQAQPSTLWIWGQSDSD